MDQQLTLQDSQDAAAWYARLRAPGCSPAERRAFHGWLAADPAHGAAYERAMATALTMSNALRSDPKWKAMTDRAREDVAERPARRRLLQRWFMRPLLAGALAILCAVFVDRAFLARVGEATEQRYANEGSQRREVRLEDGSRVWLDVGAQIEVRLEHSARRLRLLSGRAYFEVAHDASRPFTVEAAGTRTTALGTEFEVDIRIAGASITLAEGAVSVLSTEAKSGWLRQLKPGQQLLSHAGQIDPQIRQVDVAAITGWSTGTLRFNGAPLRDVVAEWNRYAKVRIVIGDEDLGESQIGGSFRAGGASSDFVAAISLVLPVRVVPVGAGEILLVRQYAEPPL